MGDNRPIKTICWIKFLKSRNCTPGKGTNHTKWKCPNCCRSIIFREADKELPFFHVRTNLQTMGISIDEFLKWIEENC